MIFILSLLISLINAEKNIDQKQIFQEEESQQVEIWKQVVAGAIAGMIEIVCTYPLDIVKTRSMMATKKKESIIKVLRQMIAREGILGCWSGVTSPLLCALPWRATKFMSFSQFKRLLSFIFGNASSMNIYYNLFAGIAVGITESIIITPFEVVKIAMMSDQCRIEREFRNSWDCASKIYKKEGPKGFFRGYTATCYRQILFSTTYFVVYFCGKAYFVPQFLLPALFFWRSTSFDHESSVCHFLSGLIAGIAGSIANNPFDVIKTRIQKRMMGNSIHNAKYSNPIQGILHVYSLEGVNALYSGLKAKILRVGPGAAINFLVYEQLLIKL